jgi:osmotically-inducible protein OsmY
MQTLETFEQTIEHVADADITAAIELFFLTKKGVAAHLIDVVTHEGIVLLTGITDNLLSRERAEEIALNLRGVRGVVNELLISTPDVPDEELQRLATSALADDPATTDYPVQAAAADGVLTLTGTVQTWAEKELVLRVVRGVRGVRRLVFDNLLVNWGKITNSDYEISTQIRELLAWDIRVNSALVEVRTTDRVVHLSGTVGTAAEKTHVEATAYQAGATRVEARDLLVAYWALGHELRRDKLATRSDADIAQAVRDAFRYDPRVLSYQPLVAVHNGVVTLSGAVSNLRAKQEAERDARHIVGVWDVHNLLKVRTNRFIPDLHIGQTIREALARDPYVGLNDFSVYVRNGKAQLYGQVSSHFEQEQAGTVASGVNGVAELDNWVTVPGSPDFDGYQTYARPRPNPDFALAERIRNRYFWSASLHNQAIEVLVEKGRATLTGTVATWLDRDTAGYDAYDAGARFVDNDLLIDFDHGL